MLIVFICILHVVLLIILLIPVYCSIWTLVYGFIVVIDVINMECSYIMFYVAELNASKHLFEISAI